MRRYFEKADDVVNYYRSQSGIRLSFFLSFSACIPAGKNGDIIFNVIIFFLCLVEEKAIEGPTEKA
jgi:hypothetical protein